VFGKMTPKPGSHLRFAAKQRQVSECLQERLLNNVFGFLAIASLALCRPQQLPATLFSDP
jgi:hypothetical protein